MMTLCPRLEFADESALAGVRAVEAAGEVVRAEVVVGGGLGEHLPDDDDQVWAVTMAVLCPPFLLRRRWKRRKLNAGIGLVRPADQAHSMRTAQSSLLPLRVLPERSVSSGGFVVARTETGPGGEVGGGGELWAMSMPFAA